jgi:hypothetical protein
METKPTAADAAPISKSEREDLQRLIRQREKVMKSAAKQRSAELSADFENQLGQIYSFDQDAVWKQAVNEAEAETAKANARIQARCAKLGIPAQFAPSVDIHWYRRGENATKERRTELRRMAQTKIEAIEKKAITEIELSCLQAQTELAVSGLTSEAARGFVERLPGIETLMPRLSFAEVAGEAEPPVAEQLITPNALRQRRYRKRQAALRDAQASLPKTNGADDSGGAS